MGTGRVESDVAEPVPGDRVPMGTGHTGSENFRCSESGAWYCKQCGEEVRQICEDTIGTAPPEEADLSLGEWAVVEEIEVIRYIVRGIPKKKNW